MAEEKVTRSKGVVTNFNDQKGYGFIQPDEGGEDLFVHQTAVKSDGFRTLREGQIVEFTIILEGDKTKAVDVTAPGGGPVRRGSDRNNRGGAGGGYGFSDRRNVGGGGGECYNCGDFGHKARDCNGRIGGGNDSNCFNCGGYGHLARECPSASRRGGGNSGACFACGEPGHMARDCMGGGSNRGGGGGFGRFGGRGGVVSGGNCFNCGESGHFARECTEPSRR